MVSQISLNSITKQSTVSTTVVNFNYKFKHNKEDKEINEQIELPLPEELEYEELGFKLIKKYNLPCIEHDKLIETIKKTLIKENDNQLEQKFSKLQEEFHQNFAHNKSKILLKLNRLESIINNENHRFNLNSRRISLQHQLSNDNNLASAKSNLTTINQQSSITEDQLSEFRQKYHELIHSGFLTEPLVKLEHSFAMTLSNLVLCQEKEIKELTEKQANEMEEKIKLIGKEVNEADINLLSHQHYHATDNLRNQWSIRIAKCKEMQRKDFIDWLDNVYEDFKENRKDKILNSIKCLTDSTNQNLLNLEFRRNSLVDEKNDDNDNDDDDDLANIDKPKLEESFTINLGSQLKQSHNLRLTSIDILDLCKLNFKPNSRPSPHRIHTAMSLYSNSSALVLMTDNRISSYGNNIKTQFYRLCNLSTEFHFNELDIQFNEIIQEARYQQMKLNTSQQLNNDLLLETGDFYVTKHSNLAKIHSVYHLVTDETIYSSEINSRHPAILGLRNILKISHLNDINTIFIPLLLINELNESITLQWCTKRAELVLKCVKGFMIEISTLTPSNEENNNKTIQFLVPTSISEDLFQNLASMLSGIFRMIKPIEIKDK